MHRLIPSLEKLDTPYTYLVCYYDKKTYLPFYSELMQVDDNNIFEIFHRKRDNALVSAFYETTTGSFLKISVEVFNTEDHSMEYMMIMEENQSTIGISKGLTADHAHFNLSDGHIQNIDKIAWFRLNLETIPPYDYVSPFPDDSEEYELFKPNPVCVANFWIEKFDKRRLIWHETGIENDSKTYHRAGNIEKEPFFTYLDIMGIRWFDHLR